MRVFRPPGQRAVPADYLSEELCWLVGSTTPPLDGYASLIVLLRALLRFRRIAWRATMTIPSRPMRGLAGVYLREHNPRLIQLKAQSLLARLSQLVKSVSSMIRRCIDGQLVGQLPAADEVEDLWRDVSDKLGDGVSEDEFLVVDVDDVFARLAEFYWERKHTPAAETLGRMILEFYQRTPRPDDDVIAPEALGPERPLRDTVEDSWSFLESMGSDSSFVVDYGAGLGRARHYFYALGRLRRAPGEHDHVPRKPHYMSVEIVDSLSRLKAWPRYPNGPHLTEAFGYPCCCQEYCSKDSLIIIDPMMDATVLEAFSMDNPTRRGIWESPIEKSWPDQADMVLLINVLHEVPADRLRVLLKNLWKIVRKGGLVLVYEVLGLQKVESSYVIWYPNDLRDIFSRFGFVVVAAPGRTRDPTKGSWGHPYFLAALLRVDLDGRCVDGAADALREHWQGRVGRLTRRIEKITRRLQGGTGTDADCFEHFHAVQSLANAIRGVRQGRTTLSN